MAQVVQANLHHSRAATANLCKCLVQGKADIALIQEPYLYKGTVSGFSAKQFNILSTKTSGKLRSCIVSNKSINLTLLPHSSNEDITAVLWERGNRAKPTIMASAYLPTDAEQPTAGFTKLVENHRGSEMIIGCDANAHHTMWGSKDCNKRGKELLDYIANTNLNIINRGTDPTFINRVSSTVIDITLATPGTTAMVRDWRVSNEPSLSDHCWVVFEVVGAREERVTFRNPRKADWETYATKTRTGLSGLPRNGLRTSGDIDRQVERVTKVLVDSFEKVCPRSRAKNGSIPWWTSELETARQKARRMFDRAKRSNLSNHWDDYKLALRDFKKQTRRAKRNSWRLFCEDLQETSETARLRRVLSKEPASQSMLQKEDGTWTASSGEKLEVLLDTHFPGCLEDVPDPPIMDGAGQDSSTAKVVVTADKVEWAIGSFDPYKAPGTDLVYPAMLQKADRTLIHVLSKIFRACLKKAYVPKIWTQAKVVFIPKSGRCGHTKAKDYRPISLTSFLLKTLERLVDRYIRGKLDFASVCPDQHAYIEGRSVETALHRVVRTIERDLGTKQYTLAAFLDIEGAFNCVTTDGIVAAMSRFNLEPILVRWARRLLCDRHITSECADAVRNGTVRLGTPQGGGSYLHSSGC